MCSTVPINRLRHGSINCSHCRLGHCPQGNQRGLHSILKCDYPSGERLFFILRWLPELVLQLLFTAGMTLVDSADSVLVLYSYAGLPSTPSWSLVTRTKPQENVGNEVTDTDRKDDVSRAQTIPHDQVKMNAMSTLSITLTLMSILVAFSISLITIMGLIGERCSQCAAAANAKDGGGLAGSWWRAWARVRICTFCFCERHGSVIIQANANSGYIGVAIIGMFLVLGIGWMLRAWLRRRGQAIEPCTT